MLTVFAAGVGRIGAARGWGNCLAAYYLFCIFSGMLFAWYVVRGTAYGCTRGSLEYMCLCAVLIMTQTTKSVQFL